MGKQEPTAKEKSVLGRQKSFPRAGDAFRSLELLFHPQKLINPGWAEPDKSSQDHEDT